MIKYRKIKIGKRYIEAVSIKLLSKTLVVLRGSKGYIMCGYLNLSAAERFKDVAIKITGVSTIQGALKGRVSGFSRSAKRLGVYRGQPMRDVLKIIV